MTTRVSIAFDSHRPTPSVMPAKYVKVSPTNTREEARRVVGPTSVTVQENETAVRESRGCEQLYSHRSARAPASAAAGTAPGLAHARGAPVTYGQTVRRWSPVLHERTFTSSQREGVVDYKARGARGRSEGGQRGPLGGIEFFRGVYITKYGVGTQLGTREGYVRVSYHVPAPCAAHDAETPPASKMCKW